MNNRRYMTPKKTIVPPKLTPSSFNRERRINRNRRLSPPPSRYNYSSNSNSNTVIIERNKDEQIENLSNLNKRLIEENNELKKQFEELKIGYSNLEENYNYQFEIVTSIKTLLQDMSNKISNNNSLKGKIDNKIKNINDLEGKMKLNPED